MGERLSFYLSLGLFSSFDIDRGTKLLLKTLAQNNTVPEQGNVLDSGCGTGVIAISLKKRFPNLEITASDCDALALRFTEKNVKLNKLGSGIRVSAGMLPGSLKTPVEGAPGTFDLITSNIPAKAGNPVIKDFLQNCGLHLTEKGIAAVVIVEPLASFAEECLLESGAEILLKEADKHYCVFHFKPELQSLTQSFSAVYERTDDKISGFYGLAEFDSISYRTKVVLEMLGSYASTGRTLIWNPGLGHIPEACKTSSAIITASPNLLQLKATEFNTAAGFPKLHLPTFSTLIENIEEEIDYIVAIPDFVSGAAVETQVLETSHTLLRPKGKLMIAGKSSDIARIEKNTKGYTVKHSIKYRGFRSLLIEKR